MEQIKTLEKVLGDYEYGPIPLMKKNTWLNWYLEYIKQTNFNPLFYIIGLRRASSCKELGSAYFPKNHMMLISPKENDNDCYPGFSIYHELGHGLINNMNPKFEEKRALLLGRAEQRIVTAKLLRKDVEQALVYVAISEGTVDYLAIEAQKLSIKEGKKLDHILYALASEWDLVNFEEPKEEHVFTASTPLSAEKAALIQGVGEVSVREMLFLNYERVRNRVRMMSHIMSAFMELAAHIGYYYVRSSCEAQPACSKGHVIDYILQEPPWDIKDLHDIVCNNMKVIAKIHKT